MNTVTPKSLGFIFPPEWTMHEATWLTYPKQNDSWPERIEDIETIYNQFIKVLSTAEKVHLNVENINYERRISSDLNRIGCQMDQIIFHHFKSDDCWCRDHGPSFLLNKKGEKAIVKWEFNAWGGKYAYKNDNSIASQIASYLNLKPFKPGIIMEGGSIEVNGIGDLLTSTACLLHNNRNPGLTHEKLEEYLYNYYGVEQILWLGDGIAGDDTDGHIDDIARFISDSELVIAVEKDSRSINYRPLKENLKIAEKFRLTNGKNPEIIELPMPEPQNLNGLPLPASYANFYICNAGIVMPVFNCKQDQLAVNIMEKVFQDRKIYPLNSQRVIHGLGSWHCMSQQEPMALI
jgi:agmatine deiminase